MGMEAEATSLLSDDLSFADVDASNTSEGSPRDEAYEVWLHGILEELLSS